MSINNNPDNRNILISEPQNQIQHILPNDSTYPTNQVYPSENQLDPSENENVRRSRSVSAPPVRRERNRTPTPPPVRRERNRTPTPPVRRERNRTPTPPPVRRERNRTPTP